MTPGRLQIDDRLLTVASEALDDGLLTSHRPIGAPGKGTNPERIRVAAQDSCRIDDVLDRRAVHDGAGLRLEGPATLPRLQDHGVPAMQEHRGLEAGAGSKARVHEDHGKDLLL